MLLALRRLVPLNAAGRKLLLGAIRVLLLLLRKGRAEGLPLILECFGTVLLLVLWWLVVLRLLVLLRWVLPIAVVVLPPVVCVIITSIRGQCVLPRRRLVALLAVVVRVTAWRLLLCMLRPVGQLLVLLAIPAVRLVCTAARVVPKLRLMRNHAVLQLLLSATPSCVALGDAARIAGVRMSPSAAIAAKMLTGALLAPCADRPTVVARMLRVPVRRRHSVRSSFRHTVRAGAVHGGRRPLQRLPFWPFAA